MSNFIQRIGGGIQQVSSKWFTALTVSGVLVTIAVPAVAVIIFTEDFSSYAAATCFPDGSTFGPWTVVFAGFGCVKVETNGIKQWLHESPRAPMAGRTRSALTVGPSFSTASSSMTYDVKVTTIQQLRTMTPNPWEVGWVVWDYTDNDHFYYFIPKTNGWELGKRDPAYPGGQRFLSIGTSPTFPIRQQYLVQITQDASNIITASVNGTFLTAFTDLERPYTSGKIGLYTEDAHVHFDDVVVLQ